MRLSGTAPKRGGFKSGCKGGYWRLVQPLGGNVWRVQTGGRGIGGGPKRLAGLTVTPKRIGGGGWHKALVSDCLPLAAPIGLSPLLIRTLCGPECVLVVSTEPLEWGGGVPTPQGRGDQQDLQCRRIIPPSLPRPSPVDVSQTPRPVQPPGPPEDWGLPPPGCGGGCGKHPPIPPAPRESPLQRAPEAFRTGPRRGPLHNVGSSGAVLGAQTNEEGFSLPAISRTF